VPTGKFTLVNRTLAGTNHYHVTPTHQKSPLTIANLVTILEDLACSSLHDNLLFNAQLNTEFTSLHLEEMTWSDRVFLQDYNKVTMHHSMQWTPKTYSFWLPTHKLTPHLKETGL
jgi:hypothetical protein